MDAEPETKRQLQEAEEFRKRYSDKLKVLLRDEEQRAK
jgi:hypothetical protein